MTVVTDSRWDGENPPTTYIDFIGQPVVVGDYIVYTTSAGAGSGKQTLAKVLEFATHNGKGEPYLTRGGYDYETRQPKPGDSMWKIKVQPLKDSGWSYRSQQKDGSTRAVVLNNLEGVVKVDATNADFVEWD